MAKKGKATKAMANRKAKTSSTDKLNPFEVYHNKRKHTVTGQKAKLVAGMPGVSRSRALEKRSKTIGMEYKKRHKKNTFTDERFGADSDNMNPEDKMMARFAVERQRHHNKQVFNLEEDVLTHKGRSVEEMEEFDDIHESDDDDDKVPDQTTDLHFGGFLTKNEGGSQIHLSAKETMDEIVAKSKVQKMERQKLKEETTEQTEDLDKNWSSIQQLLAPQIKALPPKRKQADYDQWVKELTFESKAKATDRLKTDEELAKEQKEHLEHLEAERLRRTKRGDQDSNTQSADALISLKHKSKAEKVLISYDKSGKMNKNQEFEDAFNALKENNLNAESDSEDDEESGSGEEGSEDEAGSEEGEEDESDNEEEEVEEDESDNEEDEEENEGENVDESPEEEEEDNQTEALTSDIPFIISAPTKLDYFSTLIGDLNDEEIVTVIKRIIGSNHPSLNEDSKNKMSKFCVVLMDYLSESFLQGKLSKDVLNESCKAIFSIIKYVSRTIYLHLLENIKSLKSLLSDNETNRLSEVMAPKQIIYMYLIQKLYPISDFKHPILTPYLMSAAWSLTACSVTKLSDFKVGVFISNWILQCSKGKYCPEAIFFITHSVEKLCNKTFDYYSNYDKLRWTLTADKPGKLSLTELYRNNTSPTDALQALLLTLRSLMRSYHDYTGFSGVFHQVISALEKFPTQALHSDITSSITSLVSLYNQLSQKTMPFLRYTNNKPISIKMYEPKFGEVFVRDRKVKDETTFLKKKIKTEMKGAIREIRKDNKFISRVKRNEQASSDKKRKRKVNEIMGFLSKEQGEANDLKWRKKHNKD